MSTLFPRLLRFFAIGKGGTTVANKLKPPRSIHQIQLSHPRRFNAYKVAGYSFGAITAVIVGPILLWPVADVWLLPKVIASTLNSSVSNEYICKHDDNIWGRDYEIAQLQYMIDSLPNNIWILSGNTNSGKTAFIKKLICKNRGILYIDLRFFFDGNAFVFETIDSLYNTSSSGLIGKLVGCYVKLFCFITAILAQSDQHTTAMLYFHALLNHLKEGLIKYNKKNDKYPLIIFDHFEALPAALKNCKNTKNSEMLSFIIYSISQFSSSVCHDLSLAHILFVGNESFSLLQKENKNGLYLDNTSHVKGSLNYLSSSILKQCEYWNMDGINKDIAINYVVDQFKKRLQLDLLNNNSKNDNILNCMSLQLIKSIGTKAVDISDALKYIMSNIDINDNDNDKIINNLNNNIIEYINNYKKSQKFVLNSKLMDNPSTTKQLKSFLNSLKKSDQNLMEWNEAKMYFDNDQDLMINLINSNILTRKHGKQLSTDTDELIKMKLLGKDDSIYIGTIGECCDSLL